METINKKKILFIVTQSEFGGAQRYVYEMTSSLPKEKYSVLVAAGQGDGQLLQKIRLTGTPSLSLKHMKRTPYPWHVLFSVLEIYRLLKKERPDTLFLCSTTAGFIGSLASFLYRLHASSFKFQVIYRIGGWSFRDPRPWGMNKIIFWLEKLTSPLKDRIIVNSQVDLDIALKYKVCPPTKITKIYNGIDVDKLQFFAKEQAREELQKLLPKTYSVKHETFLIGTVANFYKTKGLEYLIEAVHVLNKRLEFHVPTQTSNFKILIIGEGRERKKLESLIKKYNLDNKVFLLGQIFDAYKYLKAFDVFILPSLKEGFPWIILETMAANIPIIATEVGAIPEIIKDEQEGILIESKDSKIVADKILWVLNNKDEAGRMASRAKEKLKGFKLEKMIRKTETMF